MKTVVTLSAKYQVVIPKAARKKLGLTKPAGQRFTIKQVTDREIVFRKDQELDDFLGAYDEVFPKNATAKLRQMRDED
ncbi:MAG: AbrB/MazE/SpoVT family DNA-binding domain-containing protein [Candidatus Saccharimonadales bacterium]